MDNEFEVIRPDMGKLQIKLNTTSSGEHVPEIERQIQVVKERVRATWNSLPLKNFPNRMIEQMVENAVFWLNALPVKS